MPDNPIIRSLLIPIHGGQLLVPSAVVAEVTSYHKPDQIAEPRPDWLLGISQWRNQQVPLVSFEKLLSLVAEAPAIHHRLVIFYGLESSQLPFYALVAVEVPRVVSLAESSLTNNPNFETQPGLAFSVTLFEKETAWIPDLTYLENLLRKTIQAT